MAKPRELIERGFSVCGHYVLTCLDLGCSWMELTGRLVMAAHRSADVYQSMVDKYEAAEMPGGWALFAALHKDLKELNGIDTEGPPGAVVLMVCVGDQTLVRELRAEGSN
jgi:hypothetical protein